MFLRKSGPAREPLPLAMIALRIGERVLQIGLADERLMTALASKPGISGRSALIVREDRDVVRAQSAAADAGLLLEAHVSRDTFPFGDQSFDVVIVHAPEPPDERTLAESLRVLRDGGRVVVLEPGTREGIASWWRSKPPAEAGGSGGAASTSRALERAGFRPVRLLADREGVRFFEGLKR
jgi:SAM-dependent methyltransferase